VPTGGHVRGGTSVTVFGSGFYAVDPAAGLFRVKFANDEPLHALSYTDTAAVVLSAPTPGPRPIDRTRGLSLCAAAHRSRSHAALTFRVASFVPTSPMIAASSLAVQISLNQFDFAGGQPAVIYTFYGHNVSTMTPSGGTTRLDLT
jgi:hypothetical protein